MSVSAIYNFDNPANWAYDANVIDLSGNEAKLKLVDDPELNFIQDFASDTDFVYDAAKAEFVAGAVRQKNVTPPNAIFYASYSNNQNENWSGIAGTLNNGAIITSDGLDVSAGATASCSYTLPSALGSAGTIILKDVIFNDENVGYILSSGNSQEYYIYRATSNSLRVIIKNDIGGVAADMNAGGLTLTNGVPYEIAISWNQTAPDNGEAHLFVNGVMVISDFTWSGDRTNPLGNYIYVGSYISSAAGFNGSIGSLLIYDTMVYNNSYTPDWSNIYETVYTDSNVILPEMHYTGSGTLVSFDDFITVETNAPRYSLQIGQSGDYLYFDGSAWSVSDGSYAQANTAAVFKANVSALPILGEVYGQFKIHFSESNTRQSVDTLTSVLTAQIYPVDNPTITLSQKIRMEELLEITASITASGSDSIKAVLEKDNVVYFFNGSSWVVSDGSFLQSNTFAEIEANKSTFTQTAIDFNIVLLLHSDDGTTTPIIDLLSITYDFAGEKEDTISTCAVYWYSREDDGEICGETYTVSISSMNIKYKNNISICPAVKTFTADVNGKVEANLIENINMTTETGAEVYYTVKRGNTVIANIKVPDQSGACLFDIIL